MNIIEARNVHRAFPQAVALMRTHGVERGSRNGPVLQAPWPVTTVYERPQERLVFWPSRDVNVAFLVYEALWMLAGRNDLAPLTRYIAGFGRYSDDGRSLNGAYGHRWRNVFDDDQLAVIVQRLRRDRDDRRSVLQMWDANYDLGSPSRDVPCNMIATFQIASGGELDLTVFCRSNDIVWGAYFANAFHFSVLLECMARAIGVPVGTYRQVSVNWHAYRDVFDEVGKVTKEAFESPYSVPADVRDPYREGEVVPPPIEGEDLVALDEQTRAVLAWADSGFTGDGVPAGGVSMAQLSPFFKASLAVLHAHHLMRTGRTPERFDDALDVLDDYDDQRADLVVSMRRWVVRRLESWRQKQEEALA